MSNETLLPIALVMVAVAFSLALIIAGWYLPRWIPARAEQNRTQATALWQAFSRARRQHGVLAHNLQPFDGVRSEQLRAVYDAATAQLGRAAADLEQLRALLDALPTEPATADGRFLEADWRRLWRVPLATRALRRIVRHNNALQGHLEQAGQHVDQLEAIDDALRAACRDWRDGRLQTLADATQRESAAGVVIDDWSADLLRLRRALASIEAEAGEETPIGRLDELADQLDDVQQRIVALEEAVEAGRAARARLDAVHQQVERLIGGPEAAAAQGNPAVRDFFGQARNRLETADQLRRLRDWSTAEATLKAAEAAALLAREIAAAAPLLQRLAAREADALAETRQAIAALHKLHRRAVEDGYAAAADPSAADPAQLAARLQAAHNGVKAACDEAHRLLERSNTELERLTALAETRRREAAEAWQALRRVVLTADDEPLAQSMAALDAHYESARERPILLADFVEAAQDLNARCQSQRQRLVEQRTRLQEEQRWLADAYGQAEDHAKMWLCLAEPGRTVRENVAACDQIARLVTDRQRAWRIGDLFAQLDRYLEHAGRAHAAYDEIENKTTAFNELLAWIQKRVGGPQDGVIPDELLRPIDYHLDKARREPAFDVAYKHLEDALHFAEQLPRPDRSRRPSDTTNADKPRER